MIRSKFYSKNWIILILFTLLTFNCAFGANETLTSGAFIIDQGVIPQTISNGLKPYGLVYDLVKNYAVPIKWVINPSKIKDGIDFNYKGVKYSGGPFIIPSEYRTASVNARITYWQSQGVVGVTTTTSITVPVYATLQAMPIWTLDAQNGIIAQVFLDNAGIPSTGYNWLTPAQLSFCNDLFVMPHADPTWATHSNLLYWNKTFKGGIWAGCHAVSVLEGLYNPLNSAQTMNFLSIPNLLPFISHSNGSPPYSYNFPSDPIMQFLGTIDAAQQNGSEQIYMPNAGGSWRSGVKIAVYDPTQSDVPSLSPGQATSLTFGYAFDDSTRGKVLYEGGHNIATNNADGVAAQRVFFNFSYLVAYEREVIPILTVSSDTLHAGNPTGMSASLIPPFNLSNYKIQWSSSCGGTFSPSDTQSNVAYTPPAGNNASPCFISVSISDSCGRKFTNNKPFVIKELCPTVAISTPSNLVCVGTNVTFTATITNPSSVCKLQWQNSSDGILWSNIVGANSLTYSPMPSSSIRYRAIMNCMGGSTCCN